jgi:hypothetical protein
MGDGQLTTDEEITRVKYPALQNLLKEKREEIILYKSFLKHKNLLAEFEKWYETEIVGDFVAKHPPKFIQK